MKKFNILFLFTLPLLLAACSNGLLSNNSSIQQQISDDNLSLQVLDHINEIGIYKKDLHFNIITRDHYILLVGQAKNADVMHKIDKQLATIKGVKGIYNELRIGKPRDFLVEVTDSWITASVKAKLAYDNLVNAFHIKVITEKGEVFLIGSVTNEVSEAATNLTRKIKGVKLVSRVFHIIG
ncbi:MAG: BON domain-containing protein [Psychromonas sp.]|nr:BON domain-containing protein [Psychromonas sp.]